MPIFHPPFTLHPYQVDLATRAYFNWSTILGADTGMGKGVMSLATVCLWLEDGLIDFVMVGCERGKLGEWIQEIETVTDLKPVRYSGTPKHREKLREQIKSGEISCIVGVYETFRIDLTGKSPTSKNKRGWELTDGPLLELIKDKRVAYIKDEGPARIGAKRSSALYQAHERLANQANPRVIEISATPVDRDPEGYFNVARLIAPERVGRVKDFEEDHIAAKDAYHRASVFKNLSPDMTEPGKLSLKEKMEGILLAKSKKDPEVAHLFPEEVADYSYVTLSDEETEFYNWMVNEYANDPQNDAALYTILRQFFGHPMALTLSEGGVAQSVVEKVGVKRLKALGSSKCDRVVSRVKDILSTDDQVVAFTFFGQSVLPFYEQAFRDHGWRVSVNHGALSTPQVERSKAAFRAGDTQIFLSSDAGARGINLPEAAYVEEIDCALKWSVHHQRISRVSRVDSKNPTIWWNIWIVKDTLEEDILNKAILRKGYADDLVTTDGVTTSMMKDMLKRRRVHDS